VFHELLFALSPCSRAAPGNRSFGRASESSDRAQQAKSHRAQQAKSLTVGYWRRQHSRRLLKQQHNSTEEAVSPDLFSYFVTIRRVGVTVLVGAIGEIENVNQVFQPAGRLAASNSPYPFRLR
jgi:hypothetical protein